MKRSLQHVRRGLTLIELIVVLVILIGLAGIVIPMLPNMIGRTHTSTSATNCAEVNKSIQTYEQLYFSYPDGWDSMTVGNAVATYVPGNTGFDLAPLTLTATDATTTALANAGIKTVFNFVDNPASKTFYPYGTDDKVQPTGSALSAGGTLVQLTTSGKAKLGGVNIGSGATYVVLGLGKLNSMVGRVMSETPVHFSDDPTGGPSDSYARYAAIFRTTDSTGTPLDRALLVAIVGFHADGIAGVDDHIQEYYKIVKSTQ